LYGDQVPVTTQNDIKELLKYETACFEEKYLGLPVPDGRLKKGKLQSTKDRFLKKANDWVEKYMSSAAKEILIKAVLQSLPTYAMGVFKFPVGLTEDFSKIVRDFWWGDEENRRRMHWMSWEKMTRPKSQGGVGFRDLRIFNQALLARQAWRLIHFPDSLCARVLKAKYYPSGDLLDTAFIQKTSQSWQGVIHGLELLKKGVIWRIGSGTQVKIFRDNWLPRPDAPRVSQRLANSRRRWVSELIDPISRQWDEALVRSCCPSSDADSILSIKLPSRPCDDFVAWMPESNGLFSVRSAYKLGMEPAYSRLSLGQSSAEPLGDRGIWNIVRKAKVPNKLRVFAWKTATSTLSVMSNLHHRIQTISPICPICGNEEEDGHHALVRCTIARALRVELRVPWQLPPEEAFAYTGSEWLLILLQNLPGELRSKVLFLLWRVWHHRNNIIHGDGKASISASVPFLVNYFQTFNSLTNPVPDAKGKSLSPQDSAIFHAGSGTPSSWTAPRSGEVKANVDAGWDAVSKKAGIGIIIRDCTGSVILSEWKPIRGCISAEEAEIQAVVAGLKHLINLRRWPASLETDCLRVVHVLAGSDKDRSGSWCLYEEARELLKIFTQISVRMVDRHSNGAAHCLARLGKTGEAGMLSGATPICALAVVARDCNL
jgi:ribonuclease HI